MRLPAMDPRSERWVRQHGNAVLPRLASVLAAVGRTATKQRPKQRRKATARSNETARSSHATRKRRPCRACRFLKRPRPLTPVARTQRDKPNVSSRIANGRNDATRPDPQRHSQRHSQQHSQQHSQTRGIRADRSREYIAVAFGFSALEAAIGPKARTANPWRKLSQRQCLPHP